jgi:hypothetical protein
MAPLIIIIPDANSCCGSGCAQLARTAACGVCDVATAHSPRPVLFSKGCLQSEQGNVCGRNQEHSVSSRDAVSTAHRAASYSRHSPGLTVITSIVSPGKCLDSRLPASRLLPLPTKHPPFAVSLNQTKNPMGQRSLQSGRLVEFCVWTYWHCHEFSVYERAQNPGPKSK